MLVLMYRDGRHLGLVPTLEEQQTGQFNKTS